MTKREVLGIAHNAIENDDNEFTDGFINGSLYYYDKNCQLPRPLTCQTVYTFIRENLLDRQATDRWNAGFVFGWITSLSENNPEYFFSSLVMPEEI